TNPAAALEAQVAGYTTAFTWASVLLVIGALVSAVLIKATKEDLPAEGAMVHAG
ncbi:MAG: pur, partial [Modestobacter sp.]|nr:pur [Modestobacter sp.]